MKKKLVTFRTFYHRHEAEIIRGKLDSFGIPAMIQDGNLLPSLSFYSDEAGVKLKVFEDDVQRAEKALGEENEEKENM